MRTGFAAWLVLYSFLPAWFPSWGDIIPHYHITRGEISEQDWHAHELAHQHRGEDSQSAANGAHVALDSLRANASTEIVAVYHSDALITIGSAWIAALNDALPSIAVPERVEKIVAFVLSRSRVSLALLDPPPKSIL